MNTRFGSAATVGLTMAVVCAAKAAPYYVAYEGNAFPETEGWERLYGDEQGPDHGGATRSLNEGELVLDSRRSPLIYDSYLFHRSLNPNSGESFFCEWRLNIIENNGIVADSTIGIARDGGGTLALRIGQDGVTSQREGWMISLPINVPHVFRVESTDMIAYSLSIDGAFARTGIRDLNSLNESYVAFGDGGFGGGVTSMSTWDYCRFGVVPEPAGIVVIVFIGAFVKWRS